MSDTTNETGTMARDWSAVADAWDASVDYADDLSDEATMALLSQLAPGDGDRVLELTAGPGSLGEDWSRRVGPAGTVLLSDFAPGMVAVAARRNAHLANVEVAELDACAIDRADATFDVVASRMGLMFTLDPAVALAEIRRVLATGGRFGALTWGGIEHNPWMTCVGMAAMMHGLVSGGPPVGPGGIFSLSDPVHLVALAEGAGFFDVTVQSFDTTFRSPDIATHLDRVISLAGPLAVAIRTAAPEQVAAVRETAAGLAAAHNTPSGVELPGRVLMVTGHR